MKNINFNNYRDSMTAIDIEELYELLSPRLRTDNKALLRIRLTDHINMIPKHGILERVMKDQHGWSYCAGQDYVAEIKTVRNIILKLR